MRRFSAPGLSVGDQPAPCLPSHPTHCHPAPRSSTPQRATQTRTRPRPRHGTPRCAMRAAPARSLAAPLALTLLVAALLVLAAGAPRGAAAAAPAAAPTKQRSGKDGQPRAASPPSPKPAEQRTVPGQAFHDWRTALVARLLSGAEAAQGGRGAAAAAAGVARPAARWLSIVGVRERISELKGPPSTNTTHPAAAARLRIARALLALSAAEEAAGHAGDRAGGGSSSSSGGDSGGDSGNSSGDDSSSDGDSASEANGGAGSSASAAPAAPSLPPQQARLLARLAERQAAQPYPPSRRTSTAELELVLTSFVQRAPGGRLRANGKPWLLAGFDAPHALRLASQGAEAQAKVLYLMDRAKALGLNTMRMHAFADGAPWVGSPAEQQGWHGWARLAEAQHRFAGQPVALQPAPGILNATVLSEGLDWLVHEAGLRGLRLVLVLTSGASASGMKQYVDWVDPGLSVTDFYTNDTVKSVYLDYIAALLTHASSLSGLPLREDPVVAGWQLAEAPTHPGSPSSDTLLAWLKQFGVFIKKHAPHQLLLTGLEGMFGASSPHHLALNPPAQVFDAASHGPHTYAAVCSGTDFWQHHQLPEVDVASAAVLPDAWLACNRSCKLDWTRSWVRGHLRDALRLQKPLLLAPVGALRPQPWRAALLRVVHEELQRALERGDPVGGIILAGLSHPDMADDSGLGLYLSSAAVHASRPPLTSLNERAVADLKWRRFMQHDALLACLADQARGHTTDKGEASNAAAWVDGWQDVVLAVADIGSLAHDGGGGGSGGGGGGGARAQQPAPEAAAAAAAPGQPQHGRSGDGGSNQLPAGTAVE